MEALDIAVTFAERMTKPYVHRACGAQSTLAKAMAQDTRLVVDSDVAFVREVPCVQCRRRFPLTDPETGDDAFVWAKV